MVRALCLILVVALAACGDGVSAAPAAPLDPLSACLAHHSLSTPAVASSPSPGASPILSTRAFRGCAFPGPDGAAADGYWEIAATTYAWAGHPEVTGASTLDRLTSDCTRLELGYVFRDQGPPSDVPPLLVSTGTATKVNGKPWTGEALPFATTPRDAVVVHNLSYTLSRARCVA